MDASLDSFECERYKLQIPNKETLYSILSDQSVIAIFINDPPKIIIAEKLYTEKNNNRSFNLMTVKISNKNIKYSLCF